MADWVLYIEHNYSKLLYETDRQKEMEVMQILHMNKGVGETSYAQNSKVQVQINIIHRDFLQLIIIF